MSNARTMEQERIVILEARLAAAEKRCEEAADVIREIAKGEGRYSIDPYQHACNCIEDMTKIATDWLAAHDAARKECE